MEDLLPITAGLGGRVPDLAERPFRAPTALVSVTSLSLVPLPPTAAALVPRFAGCFWEGGGESLEPACPAVRGEIPDSTAASAAAGAAVLAACGGDVEVGGWGGSTDSRSLGGGSTDSSSRGGGLTIDYALVGRGKVGEEGYS